MKNNKWLILFIVFLISLISIAIYLASTEEPFKVVELSNKNFVANRATKPYLDTIVQVGLDQLGIKNQVVMLRDKVKSKDLGNDYESEAYIIYSEGQSIIFLKPNISRFKAIEVISHELVHLDQYRTDRLKVLNLGLVCWENDTIDLLEVPYNKRPWEMEAFNYGPLLEEDIKKVLYETK